METKVLNKTKKGKIKEKKMHAYEVYIIKLLINTKLEIVLWGLLLICCHDWVLWLHFVSTNTGWAGC